MNTGWIKFHRRFLEWEWYDDINTKVLFLHILLNANYVQSKWRSLTIKPGQYRTTLNSLVVETGLTIQSLRTSLDKLKSTNEITIKTTNKYTLISINNWIEYQEINTQTNKQLTNEQQTSNTPTRGLKNDKNDKNEKNNNISLETFFSYFLKEGDEKVKQKAERFDLRDQDINFFANECIIWCKKKSIEPKNWVAWEAFFDKWINDGIYLYKKKRTKTMRARDEEKSTQPKKPKYTSVEDYYLKEEGVTIIG